MVSPIPSLQSSTPLLVMMVMTSFAVAPGRGSSPSSGGGGGATPVRVMVVVHGVVMVMLPAVRDSRMVSLRGGVGNFGNADVFVHTDGRTERICFGG